MDRARIDAIISDVFAPSAPKPKKRRVDLSDTPSPDARAGRVAGEARNYERTWEDTGRDAEALAREAVGSGVEGGIDLAEYIAMTPVRVGDLVSRSIEAGGFENMDPNEVGRAAFEAGTLPIYGAIGGVPRNAVGQVGAMGTEDFNPVKWGAGGAALAGAGTVGSDIAHDEFPGFSQEYLTDRLGPNMGYGALAGGAAAVGGALLTDDFRPYRNLPPVKPQPGGPVPPGGPRPGNAGPGSYPGRPQSGPANNPTPPPAGFQTAQPSGAPTRSQGSGNQTSSGTSAAPDEYGNTHTIAARAYLSNLFDPANPRGATSSQVASDIAPYFKMLGVSATPDTRARAAKSLEILRQKLPRDLSTVDKATLKNAIREATGKVGTLGIAGVATNDADLEALLAEIMGGGG